MKPKEDKRFQHPECKLQQEERNELPTHSPAPNTLAISRATLHLATKKRNHSVLSALQASSMFLSSPCTQHVHTQTHLVDTHFLESVLEHLEVADVLVL